MHTVLQNSSLPATQPPLRPSPSEATGCLSLGLEGLCYQVHLPRILPGISTIRTLAVPAEGWWDESCAGSEGLEEQVLDTPQTHPSISQLGKLRPRAL